MTESGTLPATPRVGDLMSHPPVAISTSTTVRSALRRMVQTGRSDLMVCDGPKFVGVLSEGDLLRAMLPQLEALGPHSLVRGGALMALAAARFADVAVDRWVVRDPVRLRPGDSAVRAASIMASRQIRRLPVLDGDRLVGSVGRAELCVGMMPGAPRPNLADGP